MGIRRFGRGPGPLATPFTLTLALSRQGRGDVASHYPPRPLWIPASAGMTYHVLAQRARALSGEVISSKEV